MSLTISLVKISTLQQKLIEGLLICEWELFKAILVINKVLKASQVLVHLGYRVLNCMVKTYNLTRLLGVLA